MAVWNGKNVMMKDKRKVFFLLTLAFTFKVLSPRSSNASLFCLTLSLAWVSRKAWTNGPRTVLFEIVLLFTLQCWLCRSETALTYWRIDSLPNCFPFLPLFDTKSVRKWASFSSETSSPKTISPWVLHHSFFFFKEKVQKVTYSPFLLAFTICFHSIYR